MMRAVVKAAKDVLSMALLVLGGILLMGSIVLVAGAFLFGTLFIFSLFL